MPWTLLIPICAIRLAPTQVRVGPRVRYLLCWFLTVLVFYNFSASKRGVYLLALYPALTSLIAVSLTDDPKLGVRSIWSTVFASAAGLVFIAAALGSIVALAMLYMSAPIFASILARLSITTPAFIPDLRHSIRAYSIIAALVPLGVAGAGVYLIAVRPPIEAAIAAVASGVGCITLAANLFVVPALANTQALAGFAAGAMSIVGRDRVGYLQALNYDVAFYSGRSIPIVRTTDPEPPDYLICWRDIYYRMARAQRERYTIVLISNPTELDGSGEMVLLKRQP